MIGKGIPRAANGAAAGSPCRRPRGGAWVYLLRVTTILLNSDGLSHLQKAPNARERSRAGISPLERWRPADGQVH
jgi:hypothetical protein